MSEKRRKWTWFKIALLVLLLLHLLLWGACSAVLIEIWSWSVDYNDRQTVILFTDFGDELALEKIAYSTFPDPEFGLGVKWNEQELRRRKEKEYPAGAFEEDWYELLEQTKISEEHRVYQFTWGTVTIKDGELSWELLEDA